MGEQPTTARRGWRERVEPGLYRAHRLSCPASAERTPGRRCRCGWELAVPGPHPSSTRIVTFAGSLPEARRERRRLLAAGRPAPPEPVSSGVEAASLDGLAADYFRWASGHLSAATVRTHDHHYVRRVHPALGHRPPGELTLRDLDRWWSELQRTGSRSAAVKARDALSAVLAAGVRWGVVAENLARRLALPPPETEKVQAVERVLEPGQLAALFAAAGSARAETMFRAAGEAGLRRAEILGLRWSDVDLTARRLTVRRAILQERGQAGPGKRAVRRETTTKGRRRRDVAISETFAGRLSVWRAEAAVEGHDVGTGYVWPGADGGPLGEGTPTQFLARVMVRAGLVDGEGRPLVNLHGLRHTAGSLMLGAGVPLIVVSRQLGHGDPQVTAGVYAHLFNDAQLDAAAAVFDALPRPETLGETLGERDCES